MSSDRVSLSAAGRCHDDHLSPVFCFLDTADFACAIRVCRQWSRVGLLKSAWPALNLEALCAGPAHRGISNTHWSGARVEFLPGRRHSIDDHVAMAHSFLNNAMWTKHASHVRLRGSCHRDSPDVEPVSPAFLGLVRFARLQSLVLTDSIPAVEHMREVFTALAPRLIALSLNPDWQSTRQSVHCTHLLSNLRLLSISAYCTGDLLAPLVHLETLHLLQRFDADENKDLIVVIRRLSVEHQLRTLKIVDTHTEWEMEQLASGLPDGLAPAALTDISLLQGLLNPTLLMLPSLTRLELGCSEFHGVGHVGHDAALPDCVSSSLRHLHIADEGRRSTWSYRDLGAHMPLVHSLDTSQLINSLSFDLSLFGELRELTANCGRDGLSLSTVQTLSKLAHLTQLTVRVHPLYSVPVLTLADLKALSRSHTLRRLVCVLAEPPADRAHWNCKPTFALKIDEAERILDFQVHVRSHANSDCAVYGLQLSKAGAAPGVRMQWRLMERACNEH